MNGSPGRPHLAGRLQDAAEVGVAAVERRLDERRVGHRAGHRLDRVGPPVTTTRPTRRAPSPSWTISSASWRSSASSASPSASSSADSGSTRTPDAPFASATTVSLVESWPSTLMRSNERFTHTPVRRSSVSASSAASVWMKQNIVAWRGEIIPAPLAWAASRTAPAGERHLEAGALRARVAREDRAARSRSASGPSAAQAARTPATTLSRGSSTPITPVEATATCSALHAQLLGGRLLHRDAPSRSRARPSPTLEQPEFAATARSRSSAASLGDDHGRAQRARWS